MLARARARYHALRSHSRQRRQRGCTRRAGMRDNGRSDPICSAYSANDCPERAYHPFADHTPPGGPGAPGGDRFPEPTIRALGDPWSARAWAASGAAGSQRCSRPTGQRGDSPGASLAGGRPCWLPPGCPRRQQGCQPAGGPWVAGRGGSRSLGRHGTPVSAALGGPVNALRRVPPPPTELPGMTSCPPWAQQRTRSDAAPCRPHRPPRG